MGERTCQVVDAYDTQDAPFSGLIKTALKSARIIYVSLHTSIKDVDIHIGTIELVGEGIVTRVAFLIDSI